MVLRENKLSTCEAFYRLQTADLSLLPPAKNKGERGQFTERLIGLTNNSDLTDLLDGEIKTFTIGQSIAVTQLGHCLPEIIGSSSTFDNSLCAKKLSQVIYIGFDKKSGLPKGIKLVNPTLEPVHYSLIKQDYEFIVNSIYELFYAGKELTTINGKNNLLQIRTKASKKSDGTYTPLIYQGVTLKDKGMAFYLKAHFGKSLFK